MARATKILRNFYRDSVSLMQLSSAFAKLPGVEQASAIMASLSKLMLFAEAMIAEACSTPGNLANVEESCISETESR